MSLADAGRNFARLIPTNRQTPPLDSRTATRPILVIARIVYHDREEWLPARAVAWSDSIVHVTYRDERDNWHQEWLPVEDVRRVIVTGRNG